MKKRAILRSIYGRIGNVHPHRDSPPHGLRKEGDQNDTDMHNLHINI